MATISLPYTLSNGTTADAAQVNSNFTTIYNDYNGGITNANISASAAIATSKINTTFPSGAIVGTTDTQTLTNKTLTNPVLTKPTINGSVGAYTSDSDGATITFDMTASNVHTVTLADNRILAVSNTSTGQPFVIRLVQDGTGGRTVTWFSTIKWPNGTAPTLSTTGSRVDVFGFITTGSNTYDGFIVGQNLS